MENEFRDLPLDIQDALNAPIYTDDGDDGDISKMMENLRSAPTAADYREPIGKSNMIKHNQGELAKSLEKMSMESKKARLRDWIVKKLGQGETVQSLAAFAAHDPEVAKAILEVGATL